MGVGSSKGRRSRKTRRLSRGGGPKSEAQPHSVAGISRSARSRLPEMMSAARRSQMQQNFRRRTLSLAKKEFSQQKRTLETLKRKEAAAKAAATRAAKKAAANHNMSNGVAKKARTSARTLAKIAKKVEAAKEQTEKMLADARAAVEAAKKAAEDKAFDEEARKMDDILRKEEKMRKKGAAELAEARARGDLPPIHEDDDEMFGSLAGAFGKMGKGGSRAMKKNNNGNNNNNNNNA